jgi:hypothetical protein
MLLVLDFLDQALLIGGTKLKAKLSSFDEIYGSGIIAKALMDKATLI